MASDDKKGCFVSAVLTLAVLIGIGYFFAYPIKVKWHMHRNQKSEVGIVEFHGRVIDSRGDPLPDVSIGAEIDKYSFFEGRTTETTSTTSDRSGNFSFGPTKGKSLTVFPISKTGFKVRGRKWPEKDYEYWVFEFSPGHKDRPNTSASDPFTFTMDLTKRP
ncbi:MAG: hypothetical protein MI807_08435 [Verrucomicrobiales bacterium]|nr:hypothetical protein [Verrucomicrobiales bacterium]